MRGLSKDQITTGYYRNIFCWRAESQSDVKDVESYPASPPPPLAATVSPVCQFKFKWPAERGIAANVYISPDAAWRGAEEQRGDWPGEDEG